jgi:hypothetical protein
VALFAFHVSVMELPLGMVTASARNAIVGGVHGAAAAALE